jgi:quinol monooxygenase YgiN
MTSFALIVNTRRCPAGAATSPDSICAFQQYSSVEASQDFLQTSSYAAYLKEVEPLLAGAPQVAALTH